jgi:hypothetical protein
MNDNLKRRALLESGLFVLAGLALVVIFLLHLTNYRGEAHTAPAVHHTRTEVTIREDSQSWNCLTMGNRTCGPTYQMVDDTSHPEVWKAMILDDHNGYDPYRCLVQVADTTKIVCQDGWTETS